jgi:hypothetical protein
MVNADRVKHRLPSLLVDDCSNRHKKSWNKFMRSRYQLQKFNKNNPEKFNNLTNRVIADLTELEKAVEAQ